MFRVAGHLPHYALSYSRQNNVFENIMRLSNTYRFDRYSIGLTIIYIKAHDRVTKLVQY